MKSVVTVQKAVRGISLASLPREAADSSLIEVCNHAPLILQKMRDLISLILIWHSFSQWGMERVASPSAYKGVNPSDMTSCNQCPLWLPRMQDLQSLTRSWRSIPGWGRKRLATYFDQKGYQFIQKEHRHMIFNILQLTAGYLNATMNRTTRNAKPEIGPDGSSPILLNPRVGRYSEGCGPPQSSGSGFWTVLEPNRTILPVQTRTAAGFTGMCR